MTIICGIDPGQKGGLAFLDLINETVNILPLPEITLLIDHLEVYEPLIVYLEKAQTMPKQGISSAFNYGDHFGQIQGVLITKMIPYVLVPPGVWTRSIHQGCTGTSAKDKSLQAARRLFPTANFLPTGKCRKPHDGMVDALLIAEYGRRVYVR